MSDKVVMEFMILAMGILLGMPAGMLLFMLIHKFHATVSWLKQFPMWRSKSPTCAPKEPK